MFCEVGASRGDKVGVVLDGGEHAPIAPGTEQTTCGAFRSARAQRVGVVYLKRPSLVTDTTAVTLLRGERGEASRR